MMQTQKAVVTGQGEVVKPDGTVIPITLRAETELSIDELRDRTGLEIKEEK